MDFLCRDAHTVNRRLRSNPGFGFVSEVREVLIHVVLGIALATGPADEPDPSREFCPGGFVR